MRSLRIRLSQIWAWLSREGTVRAIFHTFWHVLGTLLPLFIVIILASLFRKPGEVWHFIEGGEFCILSAAVLTPATWILTRFSLTNDRRIRRFPSVVFGLAIAIMLASGSLFTAVYINKMQGRVEINNELVRNLSIIFLAISVLIFFLAYVIEYSEPAPGSPRAMEERNLGELGENFDNLP